MPVLGEPAPHERAHPRVVFDQQDPHGARKLDASVTPASHTRADFADTLASGRRPGEP